MSIPAWAARHRAGVLLATGLLTILGINAAFTLPAGIYPEATFPRIAIVVQGGTFEPADMIVAVTRPIEESLSGVIDLRRIRKSASAVSHGRVPLGDARLPWLTAPVVGRWPAAAPQVRTEASRLISTGLAARARHSYSRSTRGAASAFRRSISSTITSSRSSCSRVNVGGAGR